MAFGKTLLGDSDMEIIPGSKAAKKGVVYSPNLSVRKAKDEHGKHGWKKVVENSRTFSRKRPY